MGLGWQQGKVGGEGRKREQDSKPESKNEEKNGLSINSWLKIP